MDRILSLVYVHFLAEMRKNDEVSENELSNNFFFNFRKTKRFVGTHPEVLDYQLTPFRPVSLASLADHVHLKLKSGQVLFQVFLAKKIVKIA